MKAIFSSRLKETRTRLGLTQKQLSEKAGISPVSYSAYELGNKMPPLTIAAKVAKALDVSIDWLCGLETTHDMRTYADIARVIVALDSSIDLNYAVNTDLSLDEAGDPRVEVKLCIYRDGYLTDDYPIMYAGLNAYDRQNSINYRKFLITWEKTRSLIQSGAMDEQFFGPWLNDQYDLLNVELPKYRNAAPSEPPSFTETDEEGSPY